MIVAVYKQPGSKNWWFKFRFNGKPIRESTKQTNKRVAEQMEAARRTQLAKAEVGIRDQTPVPTLAEFIQARFLPHVQTDKAEKPKTARFYRTCSANLLADKRLSSTPLDAIDGERITAFVEQRRTLGRKVSTINRDLATLRRILHLAREWETIPAVRLVRLLSGEAQRDRVLTEDEEARYLAQAAGILHTLAALMLDCGLRPEECHRLRWNQNISDGAIEIHKGKRDGSRRRIQMTDRVSELLSAMRPEDRSGFVFPAPTKSGHIEDSSYKKPHKAALKGSGVSHFVVYSLRHTCLTRWARAGMDPFTLKYLAGHKSLATTMRYIHLAGTDAQEKLQETRSRMKAKSEDQGGHSFGHRDKQTVRSKVRKNAAK